MPLTWLGQLSPTMQQQIALQRALLALQREDEQIRLKTMPQTAQPAQPALARGLQGEVKPYAGPTPALATEEKAPAVTPSYFRPGAGSLEEALRAAEPTEGYVSGEERARLYKERMYEEREVGAKEAFDRIVTLDPAGQKVALNALRRYKREVYNAMEKEGYLSPAGELVKPAKEVKPMSRDTHTEDGWLYEDVLFDDGTSTHTIIGRAEEVEAEGATISEIINAQKLGIDIEQHEERFYRDALKFAGDLPRIGIDMVVEDGKERLAEQKDVDAWKTNMNNLIKFFRGASGKVPGAEVPVSMEDVKARFEGRPDLISEFQKEAGMTVTGVWDDEFEEAIRTYGGVE